MKRRTGVTVFGIITLVFVIASVALYVVKTILGHGFEQLLPAFLIENQDLIGHIQNVFTFNLATYDEFKIIIFFIVVGALGVAILFLLLWLIIDLIRKRYIVFGFVVMLLATNYLVALSAQAVYDTLYQFIGYGKLDLLSFIYYGVLVLTDLLLIVLFFVDAFTGKSEKAPAPEFAAEPVNNESTPTYGPVVEEEKKEVVYPYEKELDEQETKVESAPEKKAAPKKTTGTIKKAEVKEEVKKAPAKKAAPAKKEEAKPEAKKAPVKKETSTLKKEEVKEEATRKTTTIKKDDVKAPLITNEEGASYAKAYHVSRRPELNKWQVKATGSDKALKLFNTQKEAIDYANQLAANQGASIRVHSKEGKIRKAGVATPSKK